MERQAAGSQAAAAGHEGDATHERDLPKREGQASGFTCPECNGSLWESQEDDVLRFECRVEHKYGFDTLLEAKAQEVEASVWAAVNALEERAALLRKSANRARTRTATLTTQELTGRMLEQAEEAEQHAEAIRRTLLAGLVGMGASGANGGKSPSEVGPVQP